jgi:hypothetical protein
MIFAKKCFFLGLFSQKSLSENFISFPEKANRMDTFDFLLNDDNEISTSDDTHGDLESEDEVKVPPIHKRRCMMTKNFENVSKKLALAQQKEEKQKELTTCYICLSNMKWPLQICDLGHFACADCLHKQMRSRNNWRRGTKYSGLIPIYTYSWKINFQCGLCKRQANPRYAGALVTQLIDPEPILTCPTCNQLFSESAIGMHIAFCDHNATFCPLCNKRCKTCSLNDHTKNDCLKIKCKKCAFTSSYTRIQEHMVQHEIFNTSILALPVLTQNISLIGMDRFHLLLPIITAFHNLLKSPNTNCENNESVCEEIKKLLTELGMM